MWKVGFSMKHAVELVTIGSELLSGRSLNTHAQTLGGALSGMGWQLARDTTVPDERAAMQSAVAEALSRVDIVLVSGGLGATSDDITRDVLGDMFGRKVVPDAGALKVLHEKYKARGAEISEAAERQALVLEGAAVLINPVGMAAAMRLDLPDEQSVFIVPGPPNEFAGVLESHVLPWLSKTFGEREPKLETVTLTRGIGESRIVTVLEEAEWGADGVAAGFYPGRGRVEILLTADQAHWKELEQATAQIRELLADFVMFEDA